MNVVVIPVKYSIQPRMSSSETHIEDFYLDLKEILLIGRKKQ
jgi:hypothetical protein